MTGIVIGLCQLYAAYLLFRYAVRTVEKRENQARERRLQTEIARARELSDGVLKHIDKATTSHENAELNALLLIDAMNREARAKASLRAVLIEHGCSQDQIESVMDTIDAKQHKF